MWNRRLFKNGFSYGGMRVAGVDEAGRGCVIGPLVIAGALFEESEVKGLADAGVTDSKALSRKKREKLAAIIMDAALGVRYFELQPRCIDSVVFRSKPLRRLNYLETMAMAAVLRPLNPDSAFIDTCDVDHNRVKEQIQGVIPYSIDITCEPRADSTYTVTGAASILAKVRRDQRISELHEIYGDFNSGYPSDPRTRAFLEEWFRENSDGKGFIRESWQTVKKLKLRLD